MCCWLSFVEVYTERATDSTLTLVCNSRQRSNVTQAGLICLPVTCHTNPCSCFSVLLGTGGFVVMGPLYQLLMSLRKRAKKRPAARRWTHTGSSFLLQKAEVNSVQEGVAHMKQSFQSFRSSGKKKQPFLSSLSSSVLILFMLFTSLHCPLHRIILKGTHGVV